MVSTIGLVLFLHPVPSHQFFMTSRLVDVFSEDREMLRVFISLLRIERPYALNPKSGYIVSANHKIVSDDYKYFMVHFPLAS